ncbi:hypothetical protein ASF62_06800 [Leifsonia sp. Leaf325]|nr:hypothetical protein [Leifsonia sp. Leaf325]KQQ93888.1 hypothetical protein ASF62_06800 [Leifsonia sp. Leaf325]
MAENTPEPRLPGRAGRKHMSALVAWPLGLVIGGVLGVAIGYSLDSVVAGALIGIGIGIAFGVIFSPTSTEGKRPRRAPKSGR